MYFHVFKIRVLLTFMFNPSLITKLFTPIKNSQGLILFTVLYNYNVIFVSKIITYIKF